MLWPRLVVEDVLQHDDLPVAQSARAPGGVATLALLKRHGALLCHVKVDGATMRCGARMKKPGAGTGPGVDAFLEDILSYTIFVS